MLVLIIERNSLKFMPEQYITFLGVFKFNLGHVAESAVMSTVESEWDHRRASEKELRCPDSPAPATGSAGQFEAVAGR